MVRWNEALNNGKITESKNEQNHNTEVFDHLNKVLGLRVKELDETNEGNKLYKRLLTE